MNPWKTKFSSIFTWDAVFVLFSCCHLWLPWSYINAAVETQSCCLFISFFCFFIYSLVPFTYWVKRNQCLSHNTTGWASSEIKMKNCVPITRAFITQSLADSTLQRKASDAFMKVDKSNRLESEAIAVHAWNPSTQETKARGGVRIESTTSYIVK